MLRAEKLEIKANIFVEKNTLFAKYNNLLNNIPVHVIHRASQVALVVKKLCGFDPFPLGRSPGEGNGMPVQYSCLQNPMDREAGWATVYRVTKSQTQLKWHSTEGYLPTYLPHIFFIHSSLDIYLFPYLGDWLLWIMLQWTWKYRYLFERVISFLWMDTQKRDCWIVL